MKKWLVWLIRILTVLVIVVVVIDIYVVKPRSKSAPTVSPSPSPTISELSRKEVSFADKIVLASYYGWYYKSKIWATETNAEHPLAGSYDPAEDRTIDYELTLATELGLDGFVYSWNGKDNPSGTTLIKMLEKIETSDKYPEFKIAVLYENGNYQAKWPDKSFVDELTYLVTLAKSHPAFMKIDGAPVIFIYNPQSMPPSRWQHIISDVKEYAGEPYLIAMPDNWEVSDAYLPIFKTISTYADKYISLGDISAHYAHLTEQDRPLIATLIGGTSRVQKPGYDIDRSNGAYLKSRFDIAQKNQANWLYVTSWNEWYEYTQIEPSTETKFETASYLREIIGQFKNKTVTSPSAKLTLLDGKVKNEGPSNVYFLRCGAEDKSPPLIYVLKPQEQESVGHLCEQISGYLVNNGRVQN